MGISLNIGLIEYWSSLNIGLMNIGLRDVCLTCPI